MARTSPSRHRQGLPFDVSSPYSPQHSPLRPFAHPEPDHRGLHTPGMGTGRRTIRTPEQRRGARGTTGTECRSRRPPPAARPVVFYDDADREHGRPSGHQRRQMLLTADPQRRPKRPRTAWPQILTICPPTEQSQLAVLDARARPTAGIASSSSTTPFHRRPESAASGQRDTSAI